MNWDKIKKDIKEILHKNTHVSILHYVHGSKPAPLCFTTEEEYDNFINDLSKYIKGLTEINERKEENEREKGRNII